MEVLSGHIVSATCAVVRVKSVVGKIELVEKIAVDLREGGELFRELASGSKEFRSPSRQQLLVWNDDEWTSSSNRGLPRRVSAKKTHLAPLTELGALAWSQDETKVAFIAKQPNPDTLDYAFEGEGLGEGFGFDLPRLFILNIETGEIELLKEPESEKDAPHLLFYSHPCFSNSDGLIGVVNVLSAFRPAAYRYMTNRPGFLAHVGGEEIHGTRKFGISSLVRSNDIFLFTASHSQFLHSSSKSLFGCSLSGKRPLAYVEALDGLSFKSCESSKFVYFQFVKSSQTRVSRLDLKSGEISSLEFPKSTKKSSLILLDVFDSKALILDSSQHNSSLYKSSDSFSSTLNLLVVKIVEAKFQNFDSEIIIEDDFQYILHKNQQKESNLIVFLHGGPRSYSDAKYSYFVNRMLEEGFSIILVNYKGKQAFFSFFSSLLSSRNHVGLQERLASSSYQYKHSCFVLGSLGMSNSESLAGKIGTLDSKSVNSAISFEKSRNNYKTISIVGGSHGGFLGAHLAAQKENEFACFCLRNPVVALDQMLNVTEIPDWVIVEAIGLSNFNLEEKIESWFPVQDKDYSIEALKEKSPLYLAAEVCSPILLGIGGCDRRVPASQAKSYLYALKQNKKDVRAVFYPSEEHGLNSSPETSSHWIETQIGFLKQHTGQNKE